MFCRFSHHLPNDLTKRPIISIIKSLVGRIEVGLTFVESN